MSLMKKKNPRTEELSRLPEELIHHILGFLNTKDAVRASLASKSMEAAWLSSCPSLHFINLPDYFSNYASDNQKFHKYVFNTMERVSNHKINLQSFKFHTSKFSDTKTLDKWIGVALDGRVREISLNLRQGVPYCLPEILTSSSFLKSLELVCCNGCQLSLFGEGGDDHVTIINLPCLQSLTLIRVSIAKYALQRLLKGCPSLEYLKITSSADLLSDSFYDRAEVIVNSSTLNLKNLKFVFLSILTRSSMEFWLSKLLPNFTSLETLELRLWNFDVNTIKISNPHVKKIVLTHTNVAQIEIDCPMLLSLRWTACNMIIGRRGLLSSLSAVMVNHQPNFAGQLHIRRCCYTDLNNAWFHKLRGLLSTSWIAAMSLLCLLPSEEDVENGDNESLPTSAVKISQLYLMVSGPESCYSFIMNGFLSACHPDTIHLAQPPSNERKPLMHFIQFFLEKLDNWKDEDGCYCSSRIKCWKHQLKSVEIQEVSKLEGKERARYDFDILQLEPPSFCRLKFQWY